MKDHLPPLPRRAPLSLPLPDLAAFDDLEFFCSIVGPLKYITIARLELAYAVNLVRQKMHNPSSDDFA